MKKLLITTILLLSIIAGNTGVHADGHIPYELVPYYPSDIKGHWAYETMSEFIQAGIMKGYIENGEVTAKPNNPISRAEFVSLLVRSGSLRTDLDGKVFNDVKVTDWFYDPVRISSSLGLVKGINDAEFGPKREITRAEIAAIIVRAFETSISFNGEVKNFDDISNHWAKSSIEKASQAAIVAGYGATFKPNQTATRAEAISMINRAFKKETSNVPPDSELINVINKNLSDQNGLLASQQFGKIPEAMSGYSSDFYYDLGVWSSGVLQLMSDAGFTVNTQVAGELTVSVIEKSNRYAKVRAHGQTMTVTITNGDLLQEQAKDVDDYMLLRKVGDQWTIYSSQNAYIQVKETLTNSKTF